MKNALGGYRYSFIPKLNVRLNRSCLIIFLNGGSIMVTKKMKIAVCFLSLTALLSINNVHAGIGRLVFSKPALFVAGVLAYPWLHKYFFTSPAERASLLEQQAQQEENTQSNPEDEQNPQAWTGKLAQVAGNIKDNSVLYWESCKAQVSNLLNRGTQEELTLQEVGDFNRDAQQEDTQEDEITEAK